MSGKVAIRIAGYDWLGWTDAVVTRSLEQAAGSWSCSATDRYPAASHPLAVRPGQECVVLLDDEPVLTGYVDQIAIDYDARSHRVSLSGRSRTADLVDCSVQEHDSIRGLTLPDLAARLASPYGVDVVDEVGLATPIRRYVPQLGESVHEAVERLARQQAVLVTDDAQGRLVLTRAGAHRATTALRAGEGGNILSGSARYDASGRYATYHCRGQMAGDDSTYGDSLATYGVATDDEDLRGRTLELTPPDAATHADCYAYAVWEAATRAGRSVALSYVVQGWAQEDNALWEPNQIVDVIDPIARIEGEYLIVAVEYRIGAQGTTTTLTVAPREGYLLQEPRKRTPAGKRTSTSSGAWEELEDFARSLGRRILGGDG